MERQLRVTRKDIERATKERESNKLYLPSQIVTGKQVRL